MRLTFMKKLTSKLATIITSLSLIGTTLIGVCATQYPQPFIQNGVFSGAIVVGSQAKSSDILGAIDIGTHLQYALRQPSTITTSEDAIVDNGYKIQLSGERFNYGDSIASMIGDTPLTEDELPTILTTEKYVDNEGFTRNNIEYDQEIKFISNETAKLVYTQDDDLAPKAGAYLYISRNEPLYEYTIDFNNGIQYDNDDSTSANNDLKTTTLTLQGKTYTISDVSLTGNDGELSKIKLMTGDSVVWLQQGNPITRTFNGINHNIEVLDVTDKADACQVRVDGTTAIIDIDETKVINGIQIGITDVRAMHSQLEDTDVCQVSIGSSEVELRDGTSVKVDDVELDGTHIDFDQSPGELNKITISYKPRDMDDDLYLKSNSSWIDPIFSSWKIVNGGLSNSGYDTYTIEDSGGHSANIDLRTNDNRHLDLSVYELEDHSKLILGDGDDLDSQIYGDSGASLNPICNGGASSIDECEDMKILASTSSGEAHIFKLENIDIDDNTITLRDDTYGRTFEEKSYTPNTETNIDVGSFGTLPITINESNNKVIIGNSIKTSDNTIKLKNDVKLKFNTTSPNVMLTFDENELSNPNKLEVKLSPGSDEIQSYARWIDGSISNVDLEEDSSKSIMVSSAGTRVTIDDDTEDIKIEVPNKDEVYGNIFISPLASRLVEPIYGGTTYTLNKIPPGMSKLDIETSDIGNQNLISVGGPCANKITAQLLGKSVPSCGIDSGISPNTAIIKAIGQASGKVGIVVAGFEAENTRVASRILAQYDTYGLSLSPGSSYLINGTDLSTLKITKSS